MPRRASSRTGSEVDARRAKTVATALEPELDEADLPGEVPEFVKRGALLYLECDDVDLNHTDAVGPTANLLLYKIISVQKSQTKFVLKAQMPGDDSETSEVTIEDIIVGVKLYRSLHVHAAPGAAAADAAAAAEAAAKTAAAAAAASAPAAPVPQIPNVVTLRFGMQSRYTSAEYPQSGFFAAFEVDLSRLVSRVEGPAPPCGSSGTVFKKQLNGHLTGACRVDGWRRCPR